MFGRFSKKSEASTIGLEKTPSDGPPSPTGLDKTKLSTAVAPKDADQAYNFLTQTNVDVEEVRAVNLTRLRRRVDIRLVPFLLLAYTFCWLDKAILNYGNVMTLTPDLGLQGNDFSNANTFFYVALTVAELPTGFILTKVSATKWMGINAILWGAATTAVAGANGYQALVATRVLVGIFEAAVAPCLLLIVSQWYTKSEQAPRFAVWYCGLGLGQLLGGLQSFGFQHVNSPNFQGWRQMFVLMGGLTIFFGIFILFWLPDSPIKARWLNNTEKTAMLQHISVNKTGVVNTHFVKAQLLELLMDIQIYWLMTIILLVAITSGVISSYSATLLRSFGYISKESALLNAWSGFISMASSLASGYAVRRGAHRWLMIVLLILPSILGAGLFSFSTKKESVLAGIYLVNTCTATLPHMYGWAAANIAGHTKRAVAMGLVAAAFGAASTIGPQTFQAKDAPYYQPARLTVLITLSASAIMTTLLALYYRLENKRRDKAQGNAENVSLSDSEKWDNITDRQNPTFRYVY